jgi:hypothetical protein
MSWLSRITIIAASCYYRRNKVVAALNLPRAPNMFDFGHKDINILSKYIVYK